MSEMLLLIKRIGIDKTWQVAPYPIETAAGADRLAAWLGRVWAATPFEYQVITADTEGKS
jgi:hypothetical protein